MGFAGGAMGFRGRRAAHGGFQLASPPFLSGLLAQLPERQVAQAQ